MDNLIGFGVHGLDDEGLGLRVWGVFQNKGSLTNAGIGRALRRLQAAGVCRTDVGGCQNHCPFLDPYYNTAPNI